MLIQIIFPYDSSIDVLLTKEKMSDLLDPGIRFTVELLGYS